MRFLLGFMLFFVAVLLILIVLVQRGRGGGLTGALGGPGGQSAFGSKAGDLFTKITVWVAGFWIVLCIISIKVLSTPSSKISSNPNSQPASTGEENPGTGTGGNTTPAKDASN